MQRLQPPAAGRSWGTQSNKEPPNVPSGATSLLLKGLGGAQTSASHSDALGVPPVSCSPADTGWSMEGGLGGVGGYTRGTRLVRRGSSASTHCPGCWSSRPHTPRSSAVESIHPTGSP